MVDLEQWALDTYGMPLATYLDTALSAYRHDSAYATAMAKARGIRSDRTAKAEARRNAVDGQTYE